MSDEKDPPEKSAEERASEWLRAQRVREERARLREEGGKRSRSAVTRYKFNPKDPAVRIEGATPKPNPDGETPKSAGAAVGVSTGVFGAQPVRLAPQEPLILAHPSQMRQATSAWASFWTAAFTFFLGVAASSFPSAWPAMTGAATATPETQLQAYMFIGGAVGAIVTFLPALIGVITQLGVIGRMLNGKQCEIDVATGRLLEVPPERAEPTKKGVLGHVREWGAKAFRSAPKRNGENPR